jgi:tetratricopeptide (TPR) repeat protein
MRVLTALLFVSSLHAADWIRVRSTGIELLTDAGEKTARETLQRLAQIRGLLPATPTAPVPLRIYLFASRGEYQRYAPAPTASGFYQSGFDHDSIAMRVSLTLPREAVHEFVHSILNPRETARPAWLEEGLAEYYSNAEFRRDGVKLGAPIPEHMELLKKAKRLTAEELQTAQHDAMFYAQSWALVREMRGQVTVPLPPAVDLHLTVERISALDAQLLRGELALRTGHLPLAREMYSRATVDHSGSPKLTAALAALAEAEGDRDRAKALFKKALELDDRNAAAWFQYATLTGDESALQRSADLDPNLGEAQLLLGVHATDDGRLEEANERLERATTLLSRKSYAWYSLAFAQQKTGELAAARASVEHALQTATSPEQTAMAQALLTLLQERDALGHQ